MKVSQSGTVPCLQSRDKIIDESIDIMIWALRKNDPDSWLDMPDEGYRLVDEVEKEFKPQLDKTKYASRYPDNDNKESRRLALDYLVAFAGTTFSQGQTKFGAFEYKNESLQRHSDTSNRTGLFGKQDVDILQNLIQPNFPNVKSIADQVITFNDGTPSRKININRSADVQQSMLGDNF